MSANILDPSAIISLLPTLLPPTAKKLGSPQDGIAALLHTAMSALAFRLTAVDESASSNAAVGNLLPSEWNKNGPGHYSFKYKHEQSSLEFILTISKLGGRTVINAIAVESDRTTSLDISTNDFVSPSFYPHDLTAEDASPLIHGFISSNRVSDLLSQFKLKIIQNLIPGLRKDGYVEESGDSSTNAGGSNPPPNQNPPPARPQPQNPPYPPDEDPYRLPPRFPLRSPLQIGRSDLDPIPINPYGPWSPPPLFPGAGGDGMFVGPDHPIFGVGRGRGADRGPWGGDGFLPPIGAPPGARFDPVGPGIGPFPGRFGGRGRGNLPGRGNMGDPDNDEFMPPGAGDMFM